MDFLGLRVQLGLAAVKAVAHVVMPVRAFAFAGVRRDRMDVDVDGHRIGEFERGGRDPCLLHGLAHRRRRERVVGGLDVPARLEPPVEGPVVDEQDLVAVVHEDRRGGDVAGHGAAVEAVRAFDREQRRDRFGVAGPALEVGGELVLEMRDGDGHGRILPALGSSP
jgi:hypothetical protein